MVVKSRLRAILATLGLYLGSVLIIAYFGVHAFGGNYGLEAKASYRAEIYRLRLELEGLRAERARWEGRVALLRPESLDPDMLDERARSALNYAHAHELVWILPRR